MMMLEVIEDDINATIERLKELETLEYREFAKEKNIDINQSKRFVTEKFRALLQLRDRLRRSLSSTNQMCVSDDDLYG
jgi:hypothetical protein